MFKVRADFKESIEIKANADEVRDFFSDLGNFSELMPSVKSIHEDSSHVIHWKVIADVPFVGSFTHDFAVSETENTEDRIEWSPIEGEDKNIMRYAVEFLPKGKKKTLVQYTQNVELRRKFASQLHFLAGIAGEETISSGMTKGFEEMLHIFLEKVRKKLEG